MFKLQQDSGYPLGGPFGKKVDIDMGIELHPNGHTQKGESCHEHIARDLFHPRDPGSEEISHDDIRGDNDQEECQKEGCQHGTDKMDSIKNISDLHQIEYPSFLP